jgi:hypothetical protein
MQLPADPPARAVIDSWVFGHLHAWINPLILAARAGAIELLWSPVIIAESNRLLTWLWLQRHDGDLSGPSKRRCSQDAKVFLQIARTVFASLRTPRQTTPCGPSMHPMNGMSLFGTLRFGGERIS